jgi:tyrosine-protein phosphatase non-receptor type 14/21
LGSGQWNPAGSNTSLINRAQSSSCVDLTNSNTNINLNNNNNNHINVFNKDPKYPPKYRQAPSYETAIQQKYKGSQPDVSLAQPHIMYENFSHQQPHHTAIQQPHYPDVTHHASNNMIAPNYIDASDYLSQRLKMLSFNPPPHYPARLSSTSTPDLALASHRGLFGYRASGSSPDLVSSRTLYQQHGGYIPSNIINPYTTVTPSGIKQRLRHSHSFLPHATYENLNFIETANPNFFPTKHIPNNLIYRTASSAAAHQHLVNMEYYQAQASKVKKNLICCLRKKKTAL